MWLAVSLSPHKNWKLLQFQFKLHEQYKYRLKIGDDKNFGS